MDSGPVSAREVDEAFASLLELEPDHRQEALRELEADRPTIAREVRTLLDYAEAADDVFEDHLASLPSTLLDELSQAMDPGEVAAGARIGSYRVLRTIGRGGWGTLYLAARVGEFQHVVALKLLRRGLDTEDVLRRFESERQILASLEHPNIARLLDGGSTDDGRPYLVLTYVDGEPITDYCRARSCSLDERLQLFLQLCDAVQYAHRRLIVHRDLKPGNVLIDREGRARLLDFGIAKLLSGGGDRRHDTRAGIRLFTPEYAAPEQIEGEPATTATDVYQLCHLLYRLLTGRSPYRTSGDSIAEIQRVICQEEPLRPSRVVSQIEADPELPPAIPARRLQGDLDTILLKGLKKNPEERYVSVEALADDLRAHLEGRPVRARPESRLYRFSKLVRRNPWPTAALLVLVLGAAGWATTVNRYAAELAEERDRAQAQSRTAEEVTQFLTDLFALPGEPMGDTTTVRTVLQRGMERADTELPGDPPLRASILSVMGQSFISLGDGSDAVSLLERALDIDGGFADDPEGHLRALDRLGAAYRMVGRYDEALEIHDEALALARQLHGERSTAYSGSLNHRGLTHQETNRADAAEADFRTALEIRRELIEGDPELHRPVEAAIILSNLGNLLQQTGRLDESVTYLDEAVRLLEPHPDQDRYRGVALNVLGMALQRAGDWEAAEAALRESVKVRRATLGSRHPDLAISQHNLSVLLRNTDRHDEAENAVLESLAIRVEVYGTNHPQTELSLNSLGNLYRDSGRTDRAVEVLSDLLERRIERTGEGSIPVVISRNNLARALQDQGDYAAAEALLLDAIGAVEAADATGRPIHLTLRNNLGRLYLDWERLEEARTILAETLVHREEVLGPQHPDTEITRQLLESTLQQANGGGER